MPSHLHRQDKANSSCPSMAGTSQAVFDYGACVFTHGTDLTGGSFLSSQRPPSRSWCWWPAWTAALTPSIYLLISVISPRSFCPGQRALHGLHRRSTVQLTTTAPGPFVRLSGISTFTNYKTHSESADVRQAANFLKYCGSFYIVHCLHIQIRHHWSWLKYTCIKKAYRERTLLWFI